LETSSFEIPCSILDIHFDLSTTFRTTASGSVFSLDPGLNNIPCASHTRGHTDCVSRAIFRTGAALHAAVQIINPGFFILKEKDSMGAYDLAHSATHAFFFVQFQGRHTGEISKIFHLQILSQKVPKMTKVS
jgi:hypothetical protein